LGKGVWAMDNSLAHILPTHKEFSKFSISTFDPSNQPQDDYFFWHGGSTAVLKGPEVKYYLNKDGFRSQDFNNFNIKDTNILCAGDSFTFGDSLPLECVWPSILQKTLKDKGSNVEIYNVGSNGQSIRQMIKNSMGFVRKYGKPNYIIMLTSPTTRDIIFDKKNQEFIYAMYEENWVKLGNNKSREARLRFYYGLDEYESLFKAIDLLFLFEDFCAASGIKLIWSTYEARIQQSQFDNAGFNNFFIFQDPDKDRYNHDLSYWEIAADNNHPGSKWHYNFAQEILDQMKSID
jgi:hypothetical protein